MGFDRMNSKTKKSSTNFPSVGTWNPRKRLFRSTIIILPYHYQHHFSSFSSSVRSVLFEHLRSQPHQPICFRLVAQLYIPEERDQDVEPPVLAQDYWSPRVPPKIPLEEPAETFAPYRCWRCSMLWGKSVPWLKTLVGWVLQGMNSYQFIFRECFHKPI